MLARYSGLRFKALAARERGAAGLIVVTGPRSPNAGALVPLRFDTAVSDSGIVAATVNGELGAAIRARRQDAAMVRRDPRRTIPASSVDHDDFRFRAESGLCSPERLIEARFLVERRHDDGELRSGMRRPPRRSGGGFRLPCHPRSGSSRISRRTPFTERGCRNAMRAPPAPRRIRGGMASAPAASAAATASSRSSTQTHTW